MPLTTGPFRADSIKTLEMQRLVSGHHFKEGVAGSFCARASSGHISALSSR